MIEKTRIYDDYLHYYTDNHRICQIAKLFLSEASSEYISAVFLIFLAVFLFVVKKMVKPEQDMDKKTAGKSGIF